MKNHGRKSFTVILMIVLVASILALAAFSVYSGTPATSSAPKVLKIGTVIPLRLQEGLEIQKWHNLFAKLLNAQGGWVIGGQKYMVETPVYDHGMDVNKGRAALEKAIFQDGVKIFVDNFIEPSVAQTAQIADQNKVLICGGGQADTIVQPNIQYYFRTGGTYFGRAMNYIIDSDYAKQGATSGICVDPDSEIGRSSANLYGRVIKMVGMKLLDPIFFANDTVDFAPVANKVKSLNAGMIDMGVSTGAQIANLISALKDAGWQGKIFPSGSISAPVFADIVKRVGSYFDGAQMPYYDTRDIVKDPKMLAFVDAYTKEYGGFRTDGLFWVAGWFILSDAINATKSVDVDVLKKYLENGVHGVQTLTGFRQLFARPDLQNYRTIDAAPGHGLGIVQNGKLVYRSTISVKDQYLVSIKVYNLVDVFQKYWDKYGKPTFPNETSVFDYADLTK